MLYTNYKALPDTFDDFVQFFVDPVNSELKEADIFKRRILDLHLISGVHLSLFFPDMTETP